MGISMYSTVRPIIRGLKPTWLRSEILSNIREKADKFFGGKKISKANGRFTINFSSHPLNGKSITLPEEITDIGWITIETPGYFQISLLKEGNIVYDGGAFPGDFTVLASRIVGERGKVYAFEPDPSNAALLKKTIEINRCNNVVVLSKALYDRTGSFKFKEDGLASRIHNSENNGSISVEAVSLDDLLMTGISPPDFIKLDVEGAEVPIINGAKKVIHKYNPSWAIASYHTDEYGRKTHTAVEKLLNSYTDVRTIYPAHLTTFAFNK